MAQDRPPKPAAQNAGQELNLAKKLAEFRELALEEPPARTPDLPVPMPVEVTIGSPNIEAPAVEPAFVPEYPKDLYTEAQIENEHREFNRRLMEARAPRDVPPYVPPPLPPALVEQTRLEMQEGARRVAEFQKIKDEQRALSRVPEPWEGKSTPIFRGLDVREYVKEFKSPVQTVSKDQLKK